MKYLCLVYHEEARADALPTSEYGVFMSEALGYRGQLRSGGYCTASDQIEFVESATTIRVRNGIMSITDGPFAETTEQLRGYYLLDARDLNDAIRVASRMPPARLGSIEVRPVTQFGAHSSPREKSVDDDLDRTDGHGRTTHMNEQNNARHGA